MSSSFVDLTEDDPPQELFDSLTADVMMADFVDLTSEFGRRVIRHFGLLSQRDVLVNMDSAVNARDLLYHTSNTSKRCYLPRRHLRSVPVAQNRTRRASRPTKERRETIKKESELVKQVSALRSRGELVKQVSALRLRGELSDAQATQLTAFSLSVHLVKLCGQQLCLNEIYSQLPRLLRRRLRHQLMFDTVQSRAWYSVFLLTWTLLEMLVILGDAIYSSPSFLSVIVILAWLVLCIS